MLAPRNLPAIGEYSKIEDLFDKATEKANPPTDGKATSANALQIGPVIINGISKASATDHQPCGAFNQPIPDETPDWHHRTGDGTSYFLQNGYHLTAAYAVAGDIVEGREDYTSSTYYESSYGLCSSPKFRWHGVNDLESDTHRIQNPEPNPEVHNYGWPYFHWPIYVLWWHNNY